MATMAWIWLILAVLFAVFSDRGAPEYFTNFWGYMVIWAIFHATGEITKAIREAKNGQA